MHEAIGDAFYGLVVVVVGGFGEGEGLVGGDGDALVAGFAADAHGGGDG